MDQKKFQKPEFFHQGNTVRSFQCFCINTSTLKSGQICSTCEGPNRPFTTKTKDNIHLWYTMKLTHAQIRKSETPKWPNNTVKTLDYSHEHFPLGLKSQNHDNFDHLSMIVRSHSISTVMIKEHYRLRKFCNIPCLWKTTWM